jgi:ferritin-like metal-binding protein YciE
VSSDRRLIKEADETASEIEDKAVFDAAIIANAGPSSSTRCADTGRWSHGQELGRDEIARFLTTNLNGEKAANTKLNIVSLRKRVNAKATTAA